MDRMIYKNFSWAFGILFLAGSSLPSALANAERSIEIPKGSQTISVLQGEIKSVGQLCPPRTMCLTDGTVIVLEFPLKSCHDKLGPVSHSFSLQNDQGVLFVSAFAFESALRPSKSCAKGKKVKHTITLFNEHISADNLKVRFLSE